MATSIKVFTASPSSVAAGATLTLYVESNIDGTVVYEIPASAPISFADGVKKIEKALVGRADTTTTSLRGTAGIVKIAASIKGEDNRKKLPITLV